MQSTIERKYYIEVLSKRVIMDTVSEDNESKDPASIWTMISSLLKSIMSTGPSNVEEFFSKLQLLLAGFPQIFTSTPRWPDSADPAFSRRRKALVLSVLRRMIHLSVKRSIPEQSTLVNAGDCLLSALQDR